MPQGNVRDDHSWVVAASIPVPRTIVRQVFKRGTFRVRAETKVDVAEVYCAECRQQYARVSGQSCVARVSRAHLTGGHVKVAER